MSKKVLQFGDKILITGSGGMLGDAIYEIFSKHYQVEASDINLTSPWLKYLDVTNKEAYETAVRNFKPDFIFHLPAETDLEYCEENYEQAYTTNVLSTKYAAELAQKYNATLVYISTAGIFDGSRSWYTENDKPKPINVYGQTKFEGELEIKDITDDYYIVRAGWMMGGGPLKDKKFVNKMVQLVASGVKEIPVVNDRWGTPTYTVDFAKNLEALLKSGQYGVYHMVCHGQCSRADIARVIASELGSDVQIIEVNSGEFTKKYFAPRPISEALLNSHLQEIHLDQMGEWQDALRRYLQTDFRSFYCQNAVMKILRKFFIKNSHSEINPEQSPRSRFEIF